MTRTTVSERDRRLLHDYVDGELSEPDRAALEERLRTELPLRREHDALARTVKALGTLPSEARPPQETWPAIAARARLAPVRAGRVAHVRVPRLAAAAVALIALSATATWLALREGASSGAAPYSEFAATFHADAVFEDHPGAQALLAEYEASTGALAEILEEGAQVLSPETLSALRRAMETVDRAIAEARGALAADPGSEELVRILMTNMRRRLELLRSAAIAVQSAA